MIHQPSHLGLLGPVPRYEMNAPKLRLSAVVVPSHRAAADVGAGLGLAARIAEAHDSQLIILRSGAAVGSPFPRDLVPVTTSPTLVVDLTEQAVSFLSAFRNGQHIVATRHRNNDTGAKRNLGLLVGQMCRWDSVLMLDDDISVRPSSLVPRPSGSDAAHPFLRLDDVLADLAADPQLRAAGYLQKGFDDNSVVCHARRLAGHDQAGFISGGALVVRCGGRPPFFPATYNEDWLFFFYALLEGRRSHPSDALKYVGNVHQSPYQPFSAPRARSEELGDVLAEGLFALMDLPKHDVCSIARTKEYWEEVIWNRQDMIMDLIQELRSVQPRTPAFDDVDDALLAALSVYEGSRRRWAGALAEYFDLLMVDLVSWYDEVDRLTPGSAGEVCDVEEALTRLGIAADVTRLEGSRPRPSLWEFPPLRSARRTSWRGGRSGRSDAAGGREDAALHRGGHGPGPVVHLELGEGA